MNSVKFCDANGVYLLRCQSSANSLFFESKNDHVLFLKLFDKYLSGMADLLHYALVPTGWVLVLKTKSSIEIANAYLKLRNESKKAIFGLSKKSCGRMISEHFRFLQSEYVKKSNASSLRHGSKVHSKFKKFIFSDKTDLERELEKMEALREFNKQWVERYLPNYEDYDVEGEMEAKGIEKSGLIYYLEKLEVHFCVRNFKLLLLKGDVVRQLIKSTLLIHSPRNHP